MYKIKLLLLFALLFFSKHFSFGQRSPQRILDSVQNLVNINKGAAKAEQLIELAGLYIGIDQKKGIEAAKEALKISEKENYTPGIASAYVALSYLDEPHEKLFNKAFDYAIKSEEPYSLIRVINVSKLLFTGKEYPKVILCLDRILPLAKKINDPKLFAKLYREKGYYYFNNSDFNKSISQFKLALQEYKKLNKNIDVAGMTMNIGVLYFKISQLDSSLKFYNQAKQVFEKNHDLTNEASAITNIALTLEKLGRAPEALALLKTAQKKYEAEKDSSLLAGAYEIIGTTYLGLGDLNNSINYAFKALNIREATHDSDFLGSSYTNICHFYYNLNNYDRSEYYARKGIEFSLKANAKEVLAACYSNLGLIYDRKNMPDSNLYYQNLSLEIRKEMGMEIEMAESYYNIAGYYFNKKEFALAAVNYKSSIALAEKSGSLEQLPKYLKGYSNFLVEEGKYNQALPLLLKAEKLLMVSKKPDELFDVYENMAICYDQTNNFKLAYRYLSLSKHISDSLTAVEKTKTNAEVLEKYETDKKQKEISLLTKDKELKNLQYQQQQENLNQQKKLLFIALGGFIILSCFAFFLFKSNREKKLANKIILTQKQEVEAQKELVEEKNNEIIDSILYAKKIQDVLLINDVFIKQHFDDNFILFKPKDIVSGDFYWGVEKNGLIFIAACDSTGHGVPGAFMSLLNMSFLNEAIKERSILSPDKILNYVRERLIETVSKDGAQDGMDGVVICFDLKKNKMSYAAAHNAPVIIRDGALLPLNADRMPIGKGVKTEAFRLFEMEIKPNDIIYLVTDGFYDQFGGVKGKKLKQKNLLQFLLENNTQTCQQQLTLLNNYFEDWKGKLEQLDDVTVIGIRI